MRCVFASAIILAACAKTTPDTTDAGLGDSGGNDAAADVTDAKLDVGPDVVVEAGHDAGTLGINLVGLWNLDETMAGTVPDGGDFADRSGYGHPGAATTSGVTFGVPGVVGKAVTLDGTSGYITIGPNAPQPLGEMSVAAWIKANTTQGSFPQIVAAGDTTGITGYNLYLYSPMSQGVAAFIVEEGTNAWGSCWVTASANLQDAKWHHLVGVYASSMISIYVDGTLAAYSSCASQTVSYGSLPIGEIGAKANGSVFGGSLQQAAVWNRALSVTEVISLYNGGLGTPLP